MESFIIRHEIDYFNVNLPFHYEVNKTTYSPVGDNVIFNRGTSILSIFNENLSGKVINIDSIEYRSIHSTAYTNNSFDSFGYSLVLGSGDPGGNIIRGMPMDVLNGAVPVNFSVKQYGKTQSSNILRRVNATQYNITASSSGYGFSMFYKQNQQYDGDFSTSNTCIFKSGYDSTPIILRNGETLSCVGNLPLRNSQVFVNIVLKDTNNLGFGTQIYTFNSFLSQDFDLFSIVNQEPGLVVEILEINVDFKICYTHPNFTPSISTDIPDVLAVYTINGYTYGEDKSVISMDSSNTLHTSGIAIKTNSRVTFKEAAHSDFLLNSLYRSSGKLPVYSTTNPSRNVIEHIGTPSYVKSNKFTKFVLEEGCGIAFFLDFFGLSGLGEIIIEFTIEEVTTPPVAGEVGFAYV